MFSSARESVESSICIGKSGIAGQMQGALCWREDMPYGMQI